MMMKRDLAIKYVFRCRERRFDWPTWNCAHFTFGFIREVNGTDRLSEFHHSSEEEAREILAKSGGLVALVSSILKPIDVCRAMTGDIVLSNDDGGSALGICCGVYSAFVGSTGMVYRRTPESLCAWLVE